MNWGSYSTENILLQSTLKSIICVDFFSIKTKHNSLLYPIFLVYLWKFMMGMYSLLTQLVHSWYLRYYSLF